MIRTIHTLLFFLCLSPCFSQESQVNPYKIYQEQTATLLGEKGADYLKIDSYLKTYSNNDISSDEDFAEFLAKTYPPDPRNGFLFYFYKDNSLSVTLFTPGKVVYKKSYLLLKKKLVHFLPKSIKN